MGSIGLEAREETKGQSMAGNKVQASSQGQGGSPNSRVATGSRSFWSKPLLIFQERVANMVLYSKKKRLA